MKDLTHYFHCPVKEKEDSQKENVGVINDDAEEEEMYKVKKKHSHEKKLSLSSSSLDIKESDGDGPSETKKAKKKIRSKRNKIDHDKTTFVSKNNGVTKRKRQRAVTQDEEDLSACLPRKVMKQVSDQATSSQSHVEKENVKFEFSQKTNSSIIENKTLESEKSKVSNNASVSDFPHEKDDCQSVKKILKSNSSIVSNHSQGDVGNSTVGQQKKVSVKKAKSLSLKRTGTAKKSNSEIIITHTSPAEDSSKHSPVLSDRNNAFHILMTSRSWRSPHSTEESEESPDRKKTKTVVAETPERIAEIKENKKKRKNKLEIMVKKRKMNKNNLSNTLSDLNVENKTSKETKRIIIPESDSDDDKDGANDHNKNVLKTEEESKKASKQNDSIVEETEVESKKQYNEKEQLKKGKAFKKVVSSKVHSSDKTPKKIKRRERKLSSKGRKMVIDETDEDCSEPEESPVCTKKLVIKLEKLRTSPRKIQNNTKQDAKAKLKFHMDSEDEIKRKEKKEHEGNSVLTIKKKQLSKSFRSDRDKSTTSKQEVLQENLSQSDNIIIIEEKKKKNQIKVKEEPGKEMPGDKMKAEKRTTKIDIDLEYELSESTKECPLSPKRTEETKKRNSIFSYFSKVTKEESFLKSEKIQVKAQVHSPPVSPSVKRRSISKDKEGSRRHSFRQRVSDKEDQIIVLESVVVTEESKRITTPKKCIALDDLKTPPSANSRWKMRVKLRESSVEAVSDGETGGESSDDYIFTPKKKWPSSTTSVQQKAARQVLRKAKSRVNNLSVKQARIEKDSSAASVTVDEKETKEDTGLAINQKKAEVSVKLAPVFIRSKAVPKPKVDPAVVQARQNFLKSGIPESVKKLVDMQRSMEEQYQFRFPNVTHVQQRDDDYGIWNLPSVELPSISLQREHSSLLTSEQMEAIKLGTFSNCNHAIKSLDENAKPSVPTPITSFRKLLQLLKSESPSFPIYRNFRRLRLKYNMQDTDKPAENVEQNASKEKKRRGRKSRATKIMESRNDEQTKESSKINAHVMWPEKYKPSSVEDIIGNGHSIEQLKKWLESWKRYSDEIKRGDKKGGRRRKDSSSGDEFMDSDSNDSSTGNMPNNTAILVGPHGCGKTSAVYAIASELGCKVLEINTSSKRNGKRILSELQEATQSHQVRPRGENASSEIDSFFKKNIKKARKGKQKKVSEDASQVKQDNDEVSSNRMSLILVEGVDIVYEDQDEGFVAALNSLVTSSKRPVILVTTDSHCPHLARFMELHLVLKFSAPSTKAMSVWLQLVCLLEGIRVRRTEIERLLDLNTGDVRRTMLQLQFWILSGGSTLPQRLELPDSTVHKNIVSTPIPDSAVDEHSNLSCASEDETDDTPLSVPEHTKCLEMFMEYDDHHLNNFQIPLPFDLVLIWWNLASLLSLPEASIHERISALPLLCEGITVTDTEAKSSLEELDLVKDVTSDESDSLIMKPNLEVGKHEMNIEVREENSMEGVGSQQVMKTINTTKEETVKESEGDSEQCSLQSVTTDTETRENLKSELSEIQKTDRNRCSQGEMDSMCRMMESMSALDVISLNRVTASSREPCIRSWDKVPKDGTSLNEETHCHWWENSLSRLICHHLLEGSVKHCRARLQDSRGCSNTEEVSRITFTRPTQQELRWRLVQHGADEATSPAIPLWSHPNHSSVASDYSPMLRAVCRYEQGRLVSSTRRRSRFFHYLKGLNIHVSDTTFETLCAVFAKKQST
ncbi:enhanced level of genomic instability 1 isoform X2 [Periplaneta americana]|uniref:enhanced level of genomic instability 1 isoform X2 n=1 Tax=Periplaneta americana TaxID=6978 RepID=UPI0037E96A62